MKNWKILTAVVALALLTVGASVATVSAFGWMMGGSYNPQMNPGNYVGGPQLLAPVTGTDTTTPTLYTPQLIASGNSYAGYGWGGCMGGRMGRWGLGINNYQTTTELTITQAIDIANTYVASLNNADLKVSHVEEYTNNFYGEVVEKSTGNGAFELLINKVTGVVRPEMGPNMMWNTKYSFGNGWCNWAKGTTAATPTVTVEQAKADAQQYLNSYLPGATVGDVTVFSGYYTIEVLKNNTPYGMLSVNSFTGQVWYHNWHGTFIQEQTVA
jgi:hypothetical protein